MITLQQAFKVCHISASCLTDRHVQRVTARRAESCRLRAGQADGGSEADSEAQEVDIVTSEPLIAKPRREGAQSSACWQAAGLSTGFPIPTGYAEGVARASDSSKGGYDFYGRSSPLRSRRVLNALPPVSMSRLPDRSEGGGGGGGEPPLRPVFRTSPFLAEFQRQRIQTATARILFLDEGGEFRAVLGAALLQLMLSKLRVRLNVSVECASIGAPEAGAHDRRLRQAAQELGVPLLRTLEEQRRGGARRFDEVADAVAYDLILVMDRFDYQEVLKEVAVLDAINPGGYYAGRIRRLGPFGMAAPRAAPARVAEDISDPLYGLHPSAEAETAAVRGAAKELAFACRGLASYLLALQARLGRGLTLRDALAQSLQCPLLAGGMVPHRDRLAAGLRRPATQEHGMPVDDFFAVRMVRGQRRVVRRPAHPRGFWREEANVEAELRRWMRVSRAHRLPSQRELRRSGASSLASAVDAHGGLAGFAQRMGVSMASRRPNGYWGDFDHLARALKPYLVNVGSRGGSDGSKSGDEGGGGGESRARDAGTEYVLPTHARLVEAGRADLLRAIRQHGGSAEVAARIGVGVRRGAGWTEEELVQQLQSVGAATEVAVSVPSRAQLVAAGRGDLAAAVQKLGGFEHFRQLARAKASAAAALATAAGAGASPPAGARRLRSAALPPGPSDLELLESLSSSTPSSTPSSTTGGQQEPLIEAVGRQVAEFVRASAHPGRLPTHQELLAAGRGDVWGAVQRAGGVRRLAEHLGLPHVETRGRRRQRRGGPEGGGSGGLSETGGTSSSRGVADPQEELDLLDAYEEVVFI